MLIGLSQDDGEACADVLLDMSEVDEISDVKNFRKTLLDLEMDSKA